MKTKKDIKNFFINFIIIPTLIAIGNVISFMISLGILFLMIKYL